MKEKGLTLVEVLVALGIVSVVGALILMIIVNSAGIFTDQSVKVQGGVDANEALSQMRRTVKDASSVAASYTDGATVYTTGANQLVLKLAAFDNSGNIIDNSFDYVVFFRDQKIIRMKIFPDAVSSRKPANTVLATQATDLYFQYFNAASPPAEITPVSAAKVRISLKLNKISIATSEANLRND